MARRAAPRRRYVRLCSSNPVGDQLSPPVAELTEKAGSQEVGGDCPPPRAQQAAIQPHPKYFVTNERNSEYDEVS